MVFVLFVCLFVFCFVFFFLFVFLRGFWFLNDRAFVFVNPEQIYAFRIRGARAGVPGNHTFSAFWLRSSVVSVLIRLISGT